MAFDLTRFISRFVEEAREHLARLGSGLATLERDPADREAINALLRSAHTVKGSSRMLKLAAITETVHRLEDLLGAVRDGRQPYTAELGRLLLRGVDALAGLVEHLAGGGAPAALPAADPELCAALAAAAGSPPPAAGPLPPAAPEPTPTEPAPTEPAPIAPNAPPAVRTPDTVRVRLAQLDDLVKLQGEVVSSHARMQQRLLDLQALIRALPPPPAEAGAADPWSAHGARLRGFAQALRDDVQAQERLMEELHDRALVMRMLPLAMIFDGAGRMVRELARSVGKEADCTVGGADIALDRQVIEQLGDPIVHLLRNAVDHGLEPPAVRTAAGKPARGRISLSARQDGNRVLIEIADDGAGLSCAAIRDKAVGRGLLTREQADALSDAETVDLIFLPGLSTAAIITDLSGRGVGLDVVKQSIVDELQGTVTVDTRPGAGTRFILGLPLSLAVMRMLLVEAGGLPFAFTARQVAELVRVPLPELLAIAERPMVVIRNEFVPVVPLAELLESPGRRPGSVAEAGAGADSLLLVVVQVRGEKLALRVDGLLDERNMVLKPLPRHLRRFPLVSGMVMTGRNELVSVLHAPALLEAARHRRAAARSEAPATAARILVVDDSLNTREIEKDVLEACGFRVTLAEDGVDGFAKAMAEPFDAVLTDVEMPNMDGFSLTARLRQEEAYRSRPIIIVTSREKEEDKRRGIQVGADAYIVKGAFDQRILVDTLRSLLG
jgi:two-component system chemotaxis sensor kinase CheA